MDAYPIAADPVEDLTVHREDPEALVTAFDEGRDTRRLSRSVMTAPTSSTRLIP